MNLNNNKKNKIFKEIILGKNKSFCTLPFLSVTCHQNGAMSLCCEDEWIKMDSKLGSIKNISVKEYFYSHKMNEVRRKMLAGKTLKNCSRCYRNENNWVNSKRYFSNQKYSSHINDIIKNTNLVTWETRQWIHYLDIRFSNICNLACKMCYSFSSSLRTKIERELWHDRDSIHGLYNGIWKVEDLYSIVKELRELYVVWGEPFLHKEFKQLLNYLCKNGYAENIFLRVNTNLTILDSAILELLPNFSKVEFLVSCDGYKSIYNKIRLGGSWDIFKNNFFKLLKYRNTVTNFSIKVNIVVQVDNIMQITDLYLFFETLKVDKINLIILTWPKHFSISILNVDTKRKVLFKIDKFIKDDKLRSSRFQDVITTLSKNDSDKRLIKKLLLENKIYDKYILN